MCETEREWKTKKSQRQRKVKDKEKWETKKSERHRKAKENEKWKTKTSERQRKVKDKEVHEAFWAPKRFFSPVYIYRREILFSLFVLRIVFHSVAEFVRHRESERQRKSLTQKSAQDKLREKGGKLWRTKRRETDRVTECANPREESERERKSVRDNEG